MNITNKIDTNSIELSLLAAHQILDAVCAVADRAPDCKDAALFLHDACRISELPGVAMEKVAEALRQIRELEAYHDPALPGNDR